MKDGRKTAVIAGVALAGGGLYWWLSRRAEAEPPPTEYPCPYCSAVFASQQELDAHMIAEHPTAAYECPYCEAAFSTQSQLDAHIEFNHPLPEVYECPYCIASFGSQEELDAHIDSEHPTPSTLLTILNGNYAGVAHSNYGSQEMDAPFIGITFETPYAGPYCYYIVAEVLGHPDVSLFPLPDGESTSPPIGWGMTPAIGPGTYSYLVPLYVSIRPEMLIPGTYTLKFSMLAKYSDPARLHQLVSPLIESIGGFPVTVDDWTIPDLGDIPDIYTSYLVEI